MNTFPNFEKDPEGKSIRIEMETERFWIRSYRPSHFEGALKLYSDPAITRYFDHGKPRTPSEIAELMQERGVSRFREGLPFGIFSLFAKSNGAFLGHADLLPTASQNEAEIGYILRAEAQKQGFGTEAALALVRLAKEIGIRFPHLAIRSLAATVHPENTASKRILEKIGMRLIGSLRRYDAPRLLYRLVLTLPRTGKFESFGPAAPTPNRSCSSPCPEEAGPRQSERFASICPSLAESKSFKSTFAWYNSKKCMNDMPPPAHIWDAGTYHSHSSIQFDAAKELIASLDLRNVRSAIDLGCGDGKITAQLARSLPEAEILGIDASPDMIRFANETFPQNKVPNLTFQLLNIANLNETGSYDFISSFFALQWLEDIGAVYGKIRRSLKPSGVFAWIVPRHISAPLNQALEELSASPEWAEHFQSFHPGWHFRGPGELSRHLQNQGFEIRSLAEVRQEMRFASRGDLEKFVTPWLSHLDRVPPALKQSFSEQLFNRYLELEPPAADGTVPYIYYRIECVAIPRNAEATNAKN